MLNKATAKITEEQHSFLRRKCNQNFDGFYRKGLFGLNSYTQNAVSIAIVLITNLTTLKAIKSPSEGSSRQF